MKTNEEKLKDLIVETFDMRPSTAGKCIIILHCIKAIIRSEDAHRANIKQ